MHHDASAQWLKAPLPFPYSTGYYLDIFFLESDPNYGWACSLEGYVVRTTDGGQSWQGATVSRPFLESIQFLTPRIGYTSGPAGVYRSDDGGVSWRDVTPYDPNNEKGWGCFFINQNEGLYLVGGCATGIQAYYRTTDGGGSWTASYTTEPLSGLSDAIIYRDGTGYAVSSGVIWRTTDYGRSWNLHSRTGTKVWTEELAIFGRSFLLPTSGGDCDGQTDGIGSMRFSTDNAITFNEFPTGANMFGSFLINERTGWGVGDNRSVYYTEDAGQTWILRNCGITGDLDDVFFISDTLGWIAGEGLYKSNFNAAKRTVTLDPAVPLIDLCDGDSVLVTASDGFTSYTWTDGTAGQSRFLSDSGTYVVLAYDSATCLQSKDTILITLKPSLVPVILSARLEICEGESIELHVEGAFVSRTWSTGETDSVIIVKESGTFTITTLDSLGCTKVSASVEVIVHPNPKPTIHTSRSTTICLDEEVTLTADPGFVSYQWSNGSTAEAITVNIEDRYFVTVIDSNGCVGTSDTVSVTVLDVRNKVSIQLSSAGVVVVPSHPVGERACIDITILNRSEQDDLVIRDPIMLGNVFCSIPLAQLPIRIAPLATKTLQICCAAIDSGLVHDTLVIPDTCSPTLLPVVSRGQTIAYEGTSRCAVPTVAVVFRAGTAHHLSAPFPMPTDDQFELQMAPKAPVRATVIDALGSVRAHANVVEESEYMRILLNTRELPPGPYIVVVELQGAPIRSFPVRIVR